jgi:hypothetical protein
MEPVRGFEPLQEAPKTSVLPLDDTGTNVPHTHGQRSSCVAGRLPFQVGAVPMVWLGLVSVGGRTRNRTSVRWVRAIESTIDLHARDGWGGGNRTPSCLVQSQMQSHCATPHCVVQAGIEPAKPKTPGLQPG